MSKPYSGPFPAVLVVEDDPNIRDIVSEYLGGRGYRVTQAADGAEAVRIMTAGPAPDLVVSDVRMPGLSGLDLAAHVADHHPATRIILISGYFPPQVVGIRFLRKPFSMVQLANAVQAELSLNPV